MRVYHGTKFSKMFSKLSRATQEAYIERETLFMQDRRHSLLKDHALSGKWAGHRSINLTGDFRAIYQEIVAGVCQFVAIGTHHQLFGK